MNRLLFLIFFFTIISYSQTLKNYDVIINNEEIFNGSLYYDKLLSVKGFYPFFESDNFIKNKIIFNTQKYIIPLKYDIIDDELITLNNNSLELFRIKLPNSLITEFYIGDKHFVKLNNSNTIKKIYRNGFFEKHYSKNNITLYIKHIKKKLQNLDSKVTKYKFYSKTFYVLYYNNNYRIIKRKKDIFKLFPELKYLSKGFNNKINEKTITEILQRINFQLSE